MKNKNSTTEKEQLVDLRWASGVLSGAIGQAFDNVQAAINLTEVISEQGEPNAKDVAKKLIHSFSVQAVIEKARESSRKNFHQPNDKVSLSAAR